MNRGSRKKLIQNTGTLTFDLSSPILYVLGFETAVEESLDEQVREKHGIQAEFRDDGHIEIESELGRGSRFTMAAPLKYKKSTEGVAV